MPPDIRETELEEMFERFGRITACYIPGSARRDFGFIIFDSPREAEIAVRRMDGHYFSGRDLRVTIARPRNANPPEKRRDRKHYYGSRRSRRSFSYSCSRSRSGSPLGYDLEGKKCFVGNLPPRIDDRDLKEFFEDCGDVENCYIPTDTRGRKTFGFVIFFNSRDAKKAVKKKNGTRFDGSVISVDLARPRR